MISTFYDSGRTELHQSIGFPSQQVNLKVWWLLKFTQTKQQMNLLLWFLLLFGRESMTSLMGSVSYE